MMPVMPQRGEVCRGGQLILEDFTHLETDRLQPPASSLQVSGCGGQGGMEGDTEQLFA